MERTLGKHNLAKMIRQYQESEKNREWLENSTTQCPGCSVPCQKSHGALNVWHNRISMLTPTTIVVPRLQPRAFSILSENLISDVEHANR